MFYFNKIFLSFWWCGETLAARCLPHLADMCRPLPQRCLLPPTMTPGSRCCLPDISWVSVPQDPHPALGPTGAVGQSGPHPGPQRRGCKSNCDFALLTFAVWYWNTFLNVVMWLIILVHISYFMFFLLMTYWKLKELGAKKKKVLVAQSRPTLCDSMDCSLLCFSVHGIFPGKNTRVGYHFLFQGIFLTQGLNLGLLHCRQFLYCPPGKP